jgi:aminoacyl tRNA synthase complex-interacting multifunctional protein 1
LNGDAVKGLVHLKRWIMAVHDAVEEMVASAASKQGGNSNSKLPSVEIPSLDFGIAEPVQLFYYGDEEGIDDIPQAAATGAAIQKSDASKKDQGGKPASAAAPAAGGDKSGLTEEEKKAAAEKRAKKNAEKAAKKKKNKPAAAAPPAKPAGELNVTALNIKVGKIIEVWEHPESDKLWCEKIDLGEAEPRQILSGLREFYTKEEMMGKTVLALCNLKSRKLAGIPSHGMVLCASNAEHTAVEFVIPPEGAKIGERVMFGDLEGEPEPENKIAKKKMLEKLAPDLKTNDEGMVVWKDAKSKTSAGACVASKGMKNAQVS